MVILQPQNKEEVKSNRKILQPGMNIAGIREVLNQTKDMEEQWQKGKAYQCFSVPKKNGKPRLIEAPVKTLKLAQRKLNAIFQAKYLKLGSPYAYGFVYNPPGTKKKKKRNILTNARQHLGNAYLLNLDLKDFFHSISQSQVQLLFSSQHFGLDRETAAWLATLVCYKGRLPMGAPTSPVLSNFVFKPTDDVLGDWSDEHEIQYTRYADDLSFSSHREIQTDHFVDIQRMLGEAGYTVNPKKFRYFGKQQPKEVTGLVLKREKLAVSGNYKTNLKEGLKIFEKLNNQKRGYEMLYASPTVSRSLKFIRQSIEGQIGFMAWVMGKENKYYQKYMKRFRIAKSIAKYHYGTDYSMA